MEQATCAQKAPFAVELEPGKYWWCACGNSNKQPFCDSSHKPTNFKPLGFTIDEKKKVWLCGCKQTGNAPFCDGAHKKL